METLADVLTSIGTRIRTLRKGLNLSIEDLAGRTGLDWSWCARIERGEAAPSIGALCRIAATLHVPVGGLFSRGTAVPADYLVRETAALLRDRPAAQQKHILKGLRAMLGGRQVKK